MADQPNYAPSAIAPICQPYAGNVINSDAQMNEPFPDSVLPAQQIQGRLANGRLPDTIMADMYRSLSQQGKLTSNADYMAKLTAISKTGVLRTPSELASVGEREKQTMDKMREEFCFYYMRYRYVLTMLFSSLTSTSAGTTVTAEQQQVIKDRLAQAVTFNNKLNDMIQFMNYVARRRAMEMKDQSSYINSLNQEIQTTFDSLAAQKKILDSGDAVATLRKRMTEFSFEKNLSANNLLSLYGFLNLVALGLLFYVSRT